MSFVPTRFLVRTCHPCRFCAGMPDKKGDELVDLSEKYRIDNLAAAEGKTNFADVRLAWNEDGIGLQVVVTGKSQPAQGDAARPRFCDGVTLWIDTRDSRTSHRASRFCHQLHFLAAGGGTDRDEPAFVQSKINRASQDAPFADPGRVCLQVRSRKNGYRLEGFVPASALTGFDPAEHPRLGFFYSVMDQELGEQTLGVGSEFPFSDDPTLWAVLELVR